MRIFLTSLGIALFVSLGVSDVIAQRGPAPQIVWSPKAVKPGDWTPPHKPHTKLVDVLAKHKGKADWVETVVDDDTLRADYISMASGGTTPRRMNADTREWWVIQDGQVPYRTMYMMETVGDRPSLRLISSMCRSSGGTWPASRATGCRRGWR